MNYHQADKSELSKYLVDNITGTDSLILSEQINHLNGTSFAYTHRHLNLSVQILNVESISGIENFDFVIEYNLFNRLNNSNKPMLLREDAILYVKNEDYKRWLRDFKINEINENSKY